MNRCWPACVLVLPFIAGCGGGKIEKAAAPNVSQELKPRQPALPAAPANAQPQSVAAKAAAPPAPSKPAVDPSINPRDLFEIATGREAEEFALAGRDVAASSADRFAVVLPPANRTATDFTYMPRTASREPLAIKVALPKGFSVLSVEGVDEQLGWPRRIRCDRDGAEMALVVGGGAAIGHDGEPAESSPQINVVLDSYYMDVTEVTLEQYEAFRAAVRAEKKGTSIADPVNLGSSPDFPVLGLTLSQAIFYARWAGKDLPTEAEWEHAARGEKGFAHPWGNGRPIFKAARSPSEIVAVKSYSTDVSPFGIYDLAGNAREWCSDHFSPTAFADAQKQPAAALNNWKGARSAKPSGYRVVKGNGPGWYAWHRTGVNGGDRPQDVCFRCVLRIGAAPAESATVPKPPPAKTRGKSASPPRSAF